MVHAKTAVADGRWARVGSTNLNIQSWLGQLGARRRDRGRDFARQMEQVYLQDLENATEVVLSDERVRRRRGSADCRQGQDPAWARQGRRGRTERTRRAAAAGALRMGRTFGAALTARRASAPPKPSRSLWGIALRRRARHRRPEVAERRSPIRWECCCSGLRRAGRSRRSGCGRCAGRPVGPPKRRSEARAKTQRDALDVLHRNEACPTQSPAAAPRWRCAAVPAAYSARPARFVTTMRPVILRAKSVRLPTGMIGSTDRRDIQPRHEETGYRAQLDPPRHAPSLRRKPKSGTANMTR